MSKVAGAAVDKPSPEEIFGSLPVLGSAEYLRHLRTAPTWDLPPEVLVRAYRELAAEGDEDACRATLSRLLGEKNGRPEYLRPLLMLATRYVPPHQNYQEGLDLYQDAIARILEVLPTEQGRFAERAWASFCRQRLIDAWRRRHGRRGERLEPARAEAAPPDADGGIDPLERHLEEPPPWHAAVAPDKVAWLEAFLQRVLAKIPDPFIRGVAEDQWLSDRPSPISGGSNGKKSLTERFGKSRFQVHRALRCARARLLADLETQNEVELDLEIFRDSPQALRSRT